MNRDDIIRMAREVWGDDSGKPWHESAVTHLEAFAALVAAAEREACAKVAEAYEPRCDICPSGVAFAIRERGAP
jgi:hypothetical protein